MTRKTRLEGFMDVPVPISARLESMNGGAFVIADRKVLWAKSRVMKEHLMSRKDARKMDITIQMPVSFGVLDDPDIFTCIESGQWGEPEQEPRSCLDYRGNAGPGI
jgi:hypothetical protein